MRRSATQVSLAAGLRIGAEIGCRARRPPFQHDSLEKTGRRLTSDPIRTSLGLLPSGPDPVGEWLVHRQSPGPYLGPKGPESKRAERRLRDLCGTAERLYLPSWPGLTRPSTSSLAPDRKDVDARHKAGHDEEIR